MARLFNMHQKDGKVLLPPATRERWQPIRGGLLNLYLYDYEEFRYENGHLILRGNNGTGKSRVMALQLPFLFDGHLGSNRVEPDADPSKRMDWNLLMGRHNERLGYTWIEFGCVVSGDNNGEGHNNFDWTSTNDDGGQVPHRCKAQKFITLGCGLSATKGSGMREPWFFVTDQRIGEELFLTSDAGHALSKSGLKEAIGDRGTIYSTAKEYRQAVDEKLFGLGQQRYDAMVDLLIQLRKPQLSRHLDEKTLAGVLGEALPPPSEQMIADVAESFRGLESDRMELNRFRSACEGVDRFLKTYRRYAQIASRRRAQDVRHSQNGYEASSRELRKAERENAEAFTQLEKATAATLSLEIRDAELKTQIEALQADPKMRSADAITHAAEHELHARNDLEAAKQDAGAASDCLRRRREAQSEALNQAEMQLKKTAELLQRLLELAATCGLQSEHDSEFSSLRLQLRKTDGTAFSEPKSIREQIEGIVAALIKSSTKLKKRNEELADAERDLGQAQKGRDVAQRHVNDAIENHRAADEVRCRAVDDFLEAYSMWRRDSDELIVPSADEIAADVDNWSHSLENVGPVAIAVRKAESGARHNLYVERAQLQHRADELAEEEADAERLAAKFEQGFHEPPSLPFRVDDAARAIRVGAPFWSLVDFARSCPLDQRANIEAALEAAGVLNAWVTPEGSVLTPDFTDVLIVGNAPEMVTIGNLLDVFTPDESQNEPNRIISKDVIIRVLRTIGYGEQNSQTWISPDGQWRNGLLYGNCRKESAQYIGHNAREEQRIRNLAKIRIDLEDIQERLKQVERQQQVINEKSTAIAKQIEAVPDDSEIRSAATATIAAMHTTVEFRKVLTKAEQVVADRRTNANRITETRDHDARDLGLFDWIDRLDDLERSIDSYQRLLAEFWPSHEHLATLTSQLETTDGAVCEAETNVKLCEKKQHHKQIRFAKAKQRLKTLQGTIGATAAEIQCELEGVVELRSNLQDEMKQARSDETNAQKELARTEERINSRRETVKIEEDRREHACIAFNRLSALGLLNTATGESSGDEPSNWSVSRTVEIARQTDSVFSQINFDDAAWDSVQQSITTTIQELNSALSQHAFTSTLSTTDGLYCVTVPYQGLDRSVQELRELLSEEVHQRQLILDEREREIIENHLIGEVAAKLHEQIHHAHVLVKAMNAEIQKRPMSTGMMLKFDWKPDEDQSTGIIEMCKKLLAATGTWSPSERAAIGRYLQDHIKDVRASREMGTWHEHLAEAFDYRKWHRFWVMRKQETGWKRLTKRTHGTGSSGEKAVALTIPQFAAAAAHYSSARTDAPRLILLDEAFVSIDSDMRGKCMELINAFDLDFLMTSENEWGCYAGLPGVAIYQLSTRSGFNAVFLTRWIWNGKQRLRDETPLPSPARPLE